MSRAVRRLAVVLAAFLPLACGPSPSTAGGDGVGGDVDSVSAELDAVPPTGVMCLRLTVVMGATVQRQLFSVVPGQTTRFELTGLAAGPATFSGDAFNAACSAVTGKSFPTWTSDSQTVTLAPGTPTKVFLTFRQNVQALVSADFVGNPTFQEFPIPSFGLPYLISWGFSGDLWFTEPEYNRVGKITSAGVITEYVVPTAGAFPESISTLGGADAWFTETGANRIGHVTSAGVFQEFVIPTPNSGPTGIISGPAGGYWFTENYANKIGFISSTGVITEYPIPTPNSGPVGIDWSLTDRLMFTESNVGQVGVIFLNGTINEFPVPGGPGLGRISSGDDGFGFDLSRMWFIESSADKVASITFGGVVTEYNLQGGASPFDENYAFDGALYVPEPDANLIARVNPIGGMFEFEVPTPGSQPFGVPVAGGPDGKIWFTERAGRKIGAMTFP